jgi:LmbE family N-acetylglucosaminyl deacetylase
MPRPRILDAMFERTATRFLRRIHRITHRMPVRLRPIEKQRVLVVAPHPDDEVIAVGGCLALHRRAGSEITTVFVTMDPPGPDGTFVRKGEADRAAKMLGYDYRFLEVPDGRASLSEDSVARRLADVIASVKPDVIYCPFPGDHHRDHQSVAASTGDAVVRSGYRGEIRCYETWSNLWPNVGVDISEVVDDKRAAIECYQSQLGMPYIDAVLGLNRYRGLKLGVKFAEGLFACGPSTFRDLCRSLAVV